MYKLVFDKAKYTTIDLCKMFDGIPCYLNSEIKCIEVFIHLGKLSMEQLSRLLFIAEEVAS